MCQTSPKYINGKKAWPRSFSLEGQRQDVEWNSNWRRLRILGHTCVCSGYSGTGEKLQANEGIKVFIQEIKLKIFTNKMTFLCIKVIDESTL